MGDVRKKKWLSGHRLFANLPADTVNSLPSDRRFTRGGGGGRLSGHRL